MLFVNDKNLSKYKVLKDYYKFKLRFLIDRVLGRYKTINIQAPKEYDLYCYWNCSKGHTILISGTIDNIIKYRADKHIKTDENIRRIYGRSAYTVLYEKD